MTMIKSQNLAKICLGTAQFGLDYGVANKTGKVSKDEVFYIFKYAQKLGLKTLDTSIAYGNSEQVMGEFFLEAKDSFEVVSKILVDLDNFDSNKTKQIVYDSLQRLNFQALYGCLIHRFDDYVKCDHIWTVLEDLKREGVIKKIGFSLYRLEELELLYERKVSFDLIQLPFSVFDRRFEKYFKLLKEKNVEIHVRSIFLQGLAFLDEGNLPTYLLDAQPQLKYLKKIATDKKISIEALCINFVLLNSYIDKVIIGIDSLAHLKSNVSCLDYEDIVQENLIALNSVEIKQEDILLPYKWKNN